MTTNELTFSGIIDAVQNNHANALEVLKNIVNENDIITKDINDLESKLNDLKTKEILVFDAIKHLMKHCNWSFPITIINDSNKVITVDENQFPSGAKLKIKELSLLNEQNTEFNNNNSIKTTNYCDDDDLPF
jgi:hypothetical protein